jgi:hypothetical protein
MASGRVFVLESPNPLELLEGTGERNVLQQVCALLGHEVSTFLLRDKNEFCQTCSYISAIKGDKNDHTPMFLHISLHGNASGIGVGRDSISWSEISVIIQKMYEELCYYHGPVILILSACGANKQQLTSKLANAVKAGKTPFVPPEYLFVFADDEVDWRDAVVTWTIFYRYAPKINFLTEKVKVQDLLKRICLAGCGTLTYFRWDGAGKIYRRYQAPSAS